MDLNQRVLLARIANCRLEFPRYSAMDSNGLTGLVIFFRSEKNLVKVLGKNDSTLAEVWEGWGLNKKPSLVIKKAAIMVNKKAADIKARPAAVVRTFDKYSPRRFGVFSETLSVLLPERTILDGAINGADSERTG